MRSPTLIARYPAPVRLGIFLGLLLLVWLPVGGPIYGLLRNDPNLATILAMSWMLVVFLGLLVWWGRVVWSQRALWCRYGLARTRENFWEGLQGLGLGLLWVLGLFALQGLWGWVELSGVSPAIARTGLEGLVSALGIGFAEEIFFRGWLLDELERDYAPGKALGVSAAVFALLHFLKPLAEILRTWVTFPALVLLGIILVRAKRCCQGRLGVAIGLHSGLVWGYYLLNVGELVRYTGRVPVWVTGIDGNPLAGLMGLVGLSLLLLVVGK